MELFLSSLFFSSSVPTIDLEWHARALRGTHATKVALRSRIRVVPTFGEAANPESGTSVDRLTGRALEDSPHEREQRLRAVESFVRAIVLKPEIELYGPRADRASSEWLEANRVRGLEYDAHFAASGYSMAGSDLAVEMAARLVHDVLRLEPSDTFVDLGSSSGVLCLVAACLSDATRVVGLELSPARHAQALRSAAELTALRPEAAARLEYAQADIVRVPLDAYSVLFCAVQPVAAHKLLPDLLCSLRDSHVAAAAAADAADSGVRQQGGVARVRFFCAGFDMPANTEGVTATLVGGYAFVAREGESTYGRRSGSPTLAAGSSGGPNGAETDEPVVGAQAKRGAALYGTRGEGPRTVLEYSLEIDLSSRPGRSGRSEPDSGSSGVESPHTSAMRTVSRRRRLQAKAEAKTMATAASALAATAAGSQLHPDAC